MDTKPFDIEPSMIFTLKILEVVLIAAVLGIVGGIAHVARTASSTESRSTRAQIASALLVAATAAVGAFYVFEPMSPLKFIAACVIAGYAGPAVLDLLEARVKQLMTEQKVAHVTEVGKDAVTTAQKAIDAAMRPPGEPEPDSTDTLAVLQQHVDELRRELASIGR